MNFQDELRIVVAAGHLAVVTAATAGASDMAVIKEARRFRTSVVSRPGTPSSGADKKRAGRQSRALQRKTGPRGSRSRGENEVENPETRRPETAPDHAGSAKKGGPSRKR